MIVISSTELRNNMKKDLDIAKTQKVVIQLGRTETFVLTQETNLEPDEDSNRAIGMNQLKKGAKEHIRQLYKKDNK